MIYLFIFLNGKTLVIIACADFHLDVTVLLRLSAFDHYGVIEFLKRYP